jgi:hypothetical protein
VEPVRVAFVYHNFVGTDRSLTSDFVASPQLPLALPLPFYEFNNKYKRRDCYVVGRGQTDFNYDELAAVVEPIFFINDAVCLEKLARSETFFFAHDSQMRVWLDGSMKSTAVLPVNGKVLGSAPCLALGHTGPVVFYHRGEKDKEALLRMSRDEIAARQELFVHSGTMHSLLHFIWFCGFGRATFIGCDGFNGYDQRLQNRSNSSVGQYKTIRRAQTLLTALLGIEAIYRGTPVC